ncbi:MAG: AMP-binding protein, partial [Aquihabitans sp.]
PGGTLTYEALDATANRIANALRERTSPLGRPVALLLGHDVELVASIFGVLKAGAIVLVLDPLAPADVSAAVVADAGPAALVTDEANGDAAAALAGALPVLRVEDTAEASSERPPLGTGPDSPAMLAYSSGTTGGAKAAVLPHRALLHLTRGASDELRITASDRLPMLFPVSMAVAAYPMLLPLLAGGSLHIRDVRSVGLAGFHQWLADEAITVLYLSPTVARFLGDVPADLDDLSLRIVVLGGERVDGDVVNLVRATVGDGPVIANGYGTTETGVLTFYVIGEGEAFGPAGVPVGQPIVETTLVVQADDGTECGPGEIGELLVQSRYLASGYWNRSDLDAQVFTAIEGSDEVVYRTGDLVVLDEAGDLALVGRTDSEVKVGGHRVIPGEVEQAMLALPEVADVVVDARPDPMSTNELVAWVVPAGEADVTTIRRAAETAMRAPLVPARIVLVDHLPLLPNGKLDRRALPAPADDEGSSGSRPPRNATEAALTTIWERILDVGSIAPDTELSNLGAQSLDVAWALVRVEEDLGVRVPMGEVANARSIADLADVVERIRAVGGETAGLIQVQAGSDDRPPLFMVHDLHGSAFGLRHLAPQLGPDQTVWGFESPYLEGPVPPFRSLDTLALRYVTELRRIQPEGPYHLAGYSFGGVLAFEIARQLVEAGEDVPMLVVVDVGPGYRGRHYDPRKVLDKPWLQVPMPDEDASLVDEARWYAGLARRSPVDAALSFTNRTGLDRWTDSLVFQRDLRQTGTIAAGHRLWFAWRKHWELARRYQWEGRRYPGPLTLVWADESAATDGTMGWGAVVDDGLEIIHAPVPHERFLLPDGAEVLGPIIRAAIDRSISPAEG